MKISFYQLGWTTLWRDLRAGELRLLIVAVTLAVASLTAVGFFADRIKGGLQRDAKALLGGDVVLSSDNPTPQAFKDKAAALGLQSAARSATGTSLQGSPGSSRTKPTRATKSSSPVRISARRSVFIQ